jgi:hypothetical protein
MYDKNMKEGQYEHLEPQHRTGAWVGVCVLGYYGNNSLEGTYLYTQVLLYRPERAQKHSVGGALSA